MFVFRLRFVLYFLKLSAGHGFITLNDYNTLTVKVGLDMASGFEGMRDVFRGMWRPCPPSVTPLTVREIVAKALFT